jgi:hypothetical protein
MVTAWFLPKAQLDYHVKTIYSYKDQFISKTFELLDLPIQVVPHILNKGEKMVRYYGCYSNKSRGTNRKAGV